MSNRVQLTTDGLNVHLDAVEKTFGADVDYAMLIKPFGNEKPGETRYSPAQRSGTKTLRTQGRPNRHDVSTSYVERQNLAVRTCSD